MKQHRTISLKLLFLMDAAGALLSAFLLGVVLVQWEAVFGLPRQMLYPLAALPCFFALYDFYCFAIIKGNRWKFLRGIAYLNFVYCGLSLGFALYHANVITIWGWGYLISEIVIVAVLASYELRVAGTSSHVAP